MISVGGLVITALLVAAPAVAGDELEDATAPELPAGLPAAVQVEVAGEQWAALHPGLYRWHLARSVYADELEADRGRYRDLVAVAALEHRALELELGAERQVGEACRRRVAAWHDYADDVDRRHRREWARDALLVTGGVLLGLVGGGGYVLSR